MKLTLSRDYRNNKNFTDLVDFEALVNDLVKTILTDFFFQIII